MSEITRSYFIKLHEKMMQDSGYRVGYQSTSQHEVWALISTAELIEACRKYMILAKNSMDSFMFGCAFAVREILWARMGKIGTAA